MTEPLHARLLNAGGELIAEGSCWLNEAAGEATLEPERVVGVLQKERGLLSLELESGRSLGVSDRPIIFRLRPQSEVPGRDIVRTLFRLRLVDSAQAATAVGAVGEGAPASSEETPAAY